MLPVISTDSLARCKIIQTSCRRQQGTSTTWGLEGLGTLTDQCILFWIFGQTKRDWWHEVSGPFHDNWPSLPRHWRKTNFIAKNIFPRSSFVNWRPFCNHGIVVNHFSYFVCFCWQIEKPQFMILIWKKWYWYELIVNQFSLSGLVTSTTKINEHTHQEYTVFFNAQTLY